MANSSKDYDPTHKKVVVVKSNEFFSLKQANIRLQREKLEELKGNLTSGNVSFMSKVCNQANSSTPSYSICTQGNPNSSGQSLLKLPKYMRVVPGKLYKTNVSIDGKGLGKAKFINIVDLANSTKTTTEQTAVENETANLNDDVSEEKIMEMINKKYGAALEAQLIRQATKINAIPSLVDTTPKTHLESKIIQAPVVNLPSDIYDFQQKKEIVDQIGKEQDVNDEVKEAQRHLESILIVDSPEDGYSLFTRHELKKVPEKIFESPVKQEIFSPKEEKLDGDQNLDKKLQNSYVEDAFQSQNTKTGFENERTDITTKEESKKEEKQMSCDKKIWEFDPKDINFEILIAQTNSRVLGPETEKRVKEIPIAREDAVIFKEMDEFIEEINVKNDILRSEGIISKVYEDENECLRKNEVYMPQNEMNIVNEKETKEGIDKIDMDSSKSSNICVDAAKFENIVKYIINRNELLHRTKIEEAVDETKDIAMETRKNDILKKLVLESEIQSDQTENVENSDVNIPQKTVCLKEIMDENGESVNTFQIRTELHKSEVGNCTEKSNISEIPNENITKALVHDSNESAVHIVKEDGFLEPITLSNGVVISFDKGSELKETPKTLATMNRNDILAILEKARANQYDAIDNIGNDIATGKEKVKHLAGSLLEQIKMLKELYEKLEIEMEPTVREIDKDLTIEELYYFHDNLNFIKNVLEKSFPKEDKKKLKYKVISVRRKSTNPPRRISTNKTTTKVYKGVTAPKRRRNISNTLLRKTLHRMNRLLGVLEKNQTSSMGPKRTTSISTLKRLAKQNKQVLNERLVNTERRFTRSCLGEGSKTRQNQILKTHKDVEGSYDKSGNDVEGTVVLNDTINIKRNNVKMIPSRAESFTWPSYEENDKENEDVKTKSSLTSLTPKSSKVNVETKLQLTHVDDKEDVREKENIETRRHSHRYPLRSCKITNQTPEYHKGLSIGRSEKSFSFEVNYSNVIPLDKTGDIKLNYVLKNDVNPCVMLYSKTENLDESIHKKNPKNQSRYSTEGNEQREQIRYETRSRTLEKMKMINSQRVLRSRRI